MKGKRVVTVLTILCLLFALNAGLSVSAANESYITEITAASGENAVAELEAAGYNAVLLPLCGEGEKSVYIGYKTGTGTPVTGIAVLKDNGSEADSEGIAYRKASDIPLEGQEVGYLFTTSDSKAGNGIVSLLVAGSSGNADLEQYALLNDGSSPVRDESRKAFDLDPDVSSDRYLYVMRSGLCKPYIGRVCAVSGKTLKEAVINAAAQGCDYYYDNGMKSAGGDIVIIGYERTSDTTRAVRSIKAYKSDKGNSSDGTLKLEASVYSLAGSVPLPGDKPAYIYSSTDLQAGDPVLLLTSSSRQKRTGDTVRAWLEKTFVKAASPTASVRVLQEELYQEIYKSTDELSFLPVTDENGAVSVLGYGCISDGAPEQTAPTAQTTAPETSDDFDPEHYLDEIPGDQPSAPTDGGTASVFGIGGTTSAVIFASAAVIAVLAAVYVIVKTKKSKGETDDDGKE